MVIFQRKVDSIIKMCILIILGFNVNAQTFTFSNYNTSPGAGSTANYTETSSGKTMTLQTATTGTPTWTAQCGYTSPGYGSTCFGATGLFWSVNWADLTSSVSGTITFSSTISGVSFTVYDINRNGSAALTSNLWTDVVQVTGFNGATAVTPNVSQATTADQTVTTSGNTKIVTGNQPSTGGAVTFSFSSAINKITIVYRSGASISSSSGSSTNPRQQYISIGTITGVSPLGVELLDYDLECGDDSRELSFRTLSETNASHYELYTSQDGSEFELESVFDAQGNSNQITSYREPIPYGNINYLRLKQFDFDGQFSELFTMYLSDCAERESSFVNVLGDKNVMIALPYDEPSVITLFSAEGKLLFQSKTLGNKNEVVNVSGELFSFGTYFVRIENRNKSEIVRFIYN